MVAACVAVLVGGCSPKFDWRDYRNLGIPYTVLFPAKPATQSRNINLGDDKVSMHMAAAEIDGVTFAVGSAELPDATRAQMAIATMKNTMVKNINGTVTAEAAAADGRRTVTSIEAKGSRNGEPMVLYGRFVAKDKWVYQAIVAGREKHVNKEAVDTFLTSFKTE
ncbi:hypothetical protein GM668_28205 [Duganella ginsengisoli]|uniref:Transmembrane protein n=1 Tax=Pseudoduganella ginsengisoli TaxID=1462440 RepID=A0A6L6Q9U3_9BURK|nr:hypothetical protein [Pseudoduganella ginsengisoli]